MHQKPDHFASGIVLQKKTSSSAWYAGFQISAAVQKGGDVVVLYTLKCLFSQGDVVEMRIPRANGNKTYSGYFNDFEKLADAASKYNGLVNGIYVTLNPTKPELLARASNRVNTEATTATQDIEIKKRIWLPIDIDPIRPAGISSTDDEHQKAIAKAYYIREFLSNRGWAEPIIGDSGNGAGVLYRIDLTNTEENTELLKSCLEAFDFMFTDDATEIDISVFNAARIWKLYGTIAKKGDNTPDRPHRQSAILEVPAEIKTITVEQIRQIIALAPKEPVEPKQRGYNGFDVEAWMKQYDLAISKTKSWKGGTVYVLEQCPFDYNHKYPDSCVIKTKSGALGFHCFHNSCSNHDWKALRDLKEPDRKQRSSTVKRETYEYHATDLGNAKRLVDHVSGDVRYCYPYQQWYVWNGRRWAEDKTGKLYRYAKEVVEMMLEEALGIDDDAERKKRVNFAFKCESAGAIKNMIELAQSEESIPILPEEMDIDIWAFNVQNGTIDLRTGKIKPHNRGDKITKTSPVIYDPVAKCPIWIRFLDRIFDNNQELVKYVQKQAGYALTGSTQEEDFSIHYGTGGNGKSKMDNQIAYILGDYFVKAKVETVLNSKVTQNGNAASGDVARLAGARLVIASEPNRGAELKEGTIKDLSGRDPITARRLYQEEFTFMPQFKFWLITNHKPTINGQDKGIWRRIKLVPFEVTIPDNEIDRNLDMKLKEESSGILNWMIEGCLKWQKEGMNVPSEVKEATEEYKADMDKLGDFLFSCCELDQNAKIPNKWLFLTYQAWCQATNTYPMTHRGFPQALQERGLRKDQKKCVSGVAWKGLRLNHQILETIQKIETSSGDQKTDGLTVLTAFLKTFLYTLSRKDFYEKPSKPSKPSEKKLTNHDSTINGGSNNSDGLNHLLSQKCIEAEESNRTTQNISNTPKSIIESIDKAAREWEHLKQTNLNSANVNAFCLWYCENMDKNKTPLEIKGIVEHLIEATPATGDNGNRSEDSDQKNPQPHCYVCGAMPAKNESISSMGVKKYYCNTCYYQKYPFFVDNPKGES